MDYDLIVIGSGPGGYVAAIRASQLGMKTAIVEKAELGGVCLNWGCIPTKALLKSAQVLEYLQHAGDYGFSVSEIGKDFKSVVQRSRAVAGKMSKGVQFLMKKNKIDVIYGTASVMPERRVRIKTNSDSEKVLTAPHIILATGARSRQLPNLKQDGKKIIGYREAMTLERQPESMIVVGSGAIGSEFAYFYNAMGTRVTLIELMPFIVPLEDEDISKALEKAFLSRGIRILTSSEVIQAETSGDQCTVTVRTPSGLEKIEAEVILSAVGVTPNIENIGLEETGIITDAGRIVVNDYYQTNIPGYYAIGDIVKGPALAHVASHEGIVCVEKIAGLAIEPIDYNNVPSCTYCMPEIASVGMTEKAAREKGYEIKVGQFPFTASGKATTAGHTEGFVKVIFDARYGEWLGCHMIGAGVTEMIAEVVTARKLETTGHEIIRSMHPHPTMSEAVMEAVAAAYGEVIHL